MIKFRLPFLGHNVKYELIENLVRFAALAVKHVQRCC